jgi:signal transduction histidine kinase
MVAHVMPVDTTTLLNVLAHEIRGPVSALQGFLRLLEQQPETLKSAQVADAMRRSLARLASLGTEAADLANWLTPSRQSVAGAVTLQALMDSVRQRATTTIIDELADPLPRTTIEVVDVELMARAIAALAQSVARDFDQQPVHLTCRIAAATLLIQVHPAARPATEATAGSDLPAGTSVAFGRGGMGLELVLAAHVLSAHHAAALVDSDGGIVIHVPRRLPGP